MKNDTKTLSTILITVIVILIAVVAYIYTTRNTEVVPTIDQSNQSELIDLTLYIQNKEVARISDCRVTQKVTYQVPKTSGVADASLKLLFEEELARYGVYQSVKIENGVAKVMLQSAMDPSGKPIVFLSSCEVGHIMAVLHDTLTQYPSIKSVELYSPEGKIEF